MRFYVAITDRRWFHFLKSHRHEEINFWSPSQRMTANLQPGELFLFKLKGGTKIAGGGYFQRSGVRPLSYTWHAFESANGAQSLRGFQQMLNLPQPDPVIRYRLLSESFFFDEQDYIDVRDIFTAGIQVGKYYDSEDAMGRGQWLWQQVEPLLRQPGVAESSFEEEDSELLRRSRIDRPGQAGFRLAVADNYQRCLVTTEHSLPVLEAAHITPYSDDGPNEVSNGLLLRRDVHRLFDLGFATITPDLDFKVSPALREQYANGKEYYKLEGAIVLPAGVQLPDRDRLDWHRQTVYKGD